MQKHKGGNAVAYDPDIVKSLHNSINDLLLINDNLIGPSKTNEVPIPVDLSRLDNKADLYRPNYKIPIAAYSQLRKVTGGADTTAIHRQDSATAGQQTLQPLLRTSATRPFNAS